MLTPQKLRNPRYSDLEDALIAVTVDLIQTKGAHAWSVREVAKMAGVSPGAPHYHFPSRQELAAAVAEEGFVQLRDDLDRVVGQNTVDPVENLTSVCLAYVGFATNNPQFYRAMYAADLYEAIDRSETSRGPTSHWFERLKETKAKVFGLFVELVTAGQEQGQLRPGDASHLAKVATSLAHGLALEFVDEHLGTPSSRPKHAREIFALMLSGLRASGPKGS